MSHSAPSEKSENEAKPQSDEANVSQESQLVSNIVSEQTAIPKQENHTNNNIIKNSEEKSESIGLSDSKETTSAKSTLADGHSSNDTHKVAELGIFNGLKRFEF